MKKTFQLLVLFFIFIFSLGNAYGEESSPKKGSTVCLNMIVRDESKVICKCLESVKPFIDYWVIFDTGSVDGTQKIIKDFMKDIPGELHERPWKDFAHNRNEALEVAKNKADYILIMDADETLSFPPNYVKPVFDKDFYFLTYEISGTSFLIDRIIKSELDWKWKGVLHEYLECPQAKTSGIITEIVKHTTSNGYRSHNPKKFQHDAEVLEEALKEDPNNTRYAFYLAQSYKDAGEYDLAIKNYNRRVEMGGWEEEVFWSLYQIAKIQEWQKMPEDVIAKSYWKAYTYRTSRIEPLYYLVNYYQNKGDFNISFSLAKLGLLTPPTKDGIFVESWISNYGMQIAFAQAAFNLGKYVEALEMCNKLIAAPKISNDAKNFAESYVRLVSDKIMEKYSKKLKKPIAANHNSILANKKILLAILARNKEHILPTFLKCIDNLDYDKKLISVYINTNNNEDKTEEILSEWVEKNKDLYNAIDFEKHEVKDLAKEELPHNWNSERLKTLAEIRNKSLKKTDEYKCDYYFVVDCDNFIAPYTLKELIQKDKPIIAPMLKAIPEENDPASNFFYSITDNGYYKNDPVYYLILDRKVIGTFKAPLVHCTYLVKAEYLNKLSYTNGTDEYEFIIFSRSARNGGVDQYICNEKIFGYSVNFFSKVTKEEEKSRLSAWLETRLKFDGGIAK